MGFTKRWLCLAALLFSPLVHAVEPVFLLDGYGNPISSTAGSLNTSTVLGAIGSGGNIIGKVGIDQTTPGTTNGVQVNAALPAGSNTIGNVGQSGSPWGVNLIQIGSGGVNQGHGTAANSLRVELPTDGTGVVGLNAGSNIVGKFGIDQTTPGTTNGVQVNAALPAGTNLMGKVGIDQTTPGTTNRVSANLDQVAGSSISQGHGTAATAIRVELPTDGTGIVGLAAGSNIAGKFGIDQTTPGTTNGVQDAADGPVSAGSAAGKSILAGGVYNSTQPSLSNGQQVAIQLNGSGAQIVNQQGRSTANASIRNAYGTTNVTTSAWVSLVTSLTSNVATVCIFDSSGQTLQLGTGGSGSQVALINVMPGGNGCEPVSIASGTHLWIEAISATASTGELDINFYQ